MQFVDMITERFRNAFVANFIWAWVLVNWELPYFIASHSSEGLGGIKKIKIFYHTSEFDFWHLLVQPLTISLLAMIVFPLLKVVAQFLAGWFDDVTQKAKTLGEQSPVFKGRVNTALAEEMVPAYLEFLNSNFEKSSFNRDDLLTSVVWKLVERMQSHSVTKIRDLCQESIEPSLSFSNLINENKKIGELVKELESKNQSLEKKINSVSSDLKGYQAKESLAKFAETATKVAKDIPKLDLESLMLPKAPFKG